VTHYTGFEWWRESGHVTCHGRFLLRSLKNLALPSFEDVEVFEE
jgi:hypothetical protein